MFALPHFNPNSSLSSLNFNKAFGREGTSRTEVDMSGIPHANRIYQSAPGKLRHPPCSRMFHNKYMRVSSALRKSQISPYFRQGHWPIISHGMFSSSSLLGWEGIRDGSFASKLSLIFVLSYHNSTHSFTATHGRQFLDVFVRGSERCESDFLRELCKVRISEERHMAK